MRGFVVAGFSALALAGAGAAQANTAHPHRPAASHAIRPFVVYGVSTREQRSELVAEGFAIAEAARADRVLVYGPKGQALALPARHSLLRSIPPDPLRRSHAG